MKSFVITLSLLLLCSSAFALHDANADLTNLLQGVFSVTKDAGIDVSSLINCFNATSQQNIENTILDLINEGAQCNPTKLNDFKVKLQTLLGSISQPENTCVQQNPLVQNLATDFGIAGLTTTQIEKKIGDYGVTHLLTLCTKVASLNNELKSGNWK